jgi:hypothetical protein
MDRIEQEGTAGKRLSRRRVPHMDGVRPPQVHAEREAMKPVAFSGRPEIRPIMIGDHALAAIADHDLDDDTALRGRAVAEPAADAMIVEVIDRAFEPLVIRSGKPEGDAPRGLSAGTCLGRLRPSLREHRAAPTPKQHVICLADDP